MIENKDFEYKFDETICSTCEGNCCTGESGYIWINQLEMINLAKLLNISVEQLAQNYLFKSGYRYSIKEKTISKDNYACVFFDINLKRCSVYSARPNQCRTFPFWDYFKNNIEELKKECPAIVK